MASRAHDPWYDQIRNLRLWQHEDDKHVGICKKNQSRRPPRPKGHRMLRLRAVSAAISLWHRGFKSSQDGLPVKKSKTSTIIARTIRASTLRKDKINLSHRNVAQGHAGETPRKTASSSCRGKKSLAWSACNHSHRKPWVSRTMNGRVALHVATAVNM